MWIINDEVGKAYGPFIDRIHRAEAVLGLFESGKDKFHIDRAASWKEEFDRAREFVSKTAANGMDDQARQSFLNKTVGPAGRENVLAAQQVEDARVAAYAAALVLTHSAIEEYLMDFLRFVCRRNHDAFIGLIGEKRVRVQTVVNGGATAAINEVREEWLRELWKSPLLKKFNCLVQLYGPDFREVLKNSSAQTLLEELDKHRQEAAHRSSTGFLNVPMNELVRNVRDAGMWIAAYEVSLSSNFTP